MSQLQHFTAQDWIVIIPIIVSSLTGAVVSIITVLRQSGHRAATEATLAQVKPPSNGHTAGELLESIQSASEVAALEATRVRQNLAKK